MATLAPAPRPAAHDPLSARTQINLGPCHPATHGTFRFMLELDGETITKCDVEIGYLHRAFEKSAEQCTWTQVIPYTDRLNYCSAMLNNVGYAQAVETLLGIPAPPRAQYIRVLVGEFSRIMDHFVCIGTNAVDVGALTNFWYFFEGRERIYDLIEDACGARLTTTYTRIGGVSYDLTPQWLERAAAMVEELPRYINDVDRLLTNNRIWIDRMRGVGAITRDEAVSYGYTGPCLRATGVAYDVRKVMPYGVYPALEFDVPTATGGDCYDRFLVRMEEMRQSLRILKQALRDLPQGPVMADLPEVTLPSKDLAYTSMESLIRHFKIIMEGPKIPKGRAYSCTEGGNGELGYYIVSDGGGRPYRVHVRGPCFPIFSSFPRLIEGQMIADAIATLGGLNVIAGELER